MRALYVCMFVYLSVCFTADCCLSRSPPRVRGPRPSLHGFYDRLQNETYTMWRPGHARRRLSTPTSVAPIVASQKSLDSIVKLDTLRKEDAGFVPLLFGAVAGRPVFFISRVHPHVRIRTHAVRMRAWSTAPYTEVEQVIAPSKPRTQNYSM